MKALYPYLGAAAITCLLVGCKGKSETTETTATPANTTAQAAASVTAAPAKSPASEAKSIFDTRCVVCHGDHGAGDGPGAAALNPKPRAFGDKTWQASVEDDHIAKIIVEGGAAVGKSPAMPPNADLKAKQEVVAELVKIVRGFGK